MISLVEEINTQVPQIYNPQDFAKFLEFAEEASDDSEFTEDNGSAREFGDLMEQLINKFKDQLKNDPDLDKRSRSLVVKLRWLTPLSLNQPNWLQILLSGSIVAAMKNNFDPFQKIQDWLYFNEFGAETNKDIRAAALNALYKNNELVGSVNLHLNTKQLVPSTVENWLKDYFSSLPPKQDLIGSFDKARYLTGNQNVRQLNEQDRETLSQIIDIYTYLKNPNESLVHPAGPDTGSTLFPGLKRTVPEPEPAVGPGPGPQVITPAIPKLVGNFEQKLSQISAPTHGADLEALRQRMGQTNPPPTPAPKPANSVRMSQDEIKHEVATKELPPYTPPADGLVKPVQLRPTPSPVPLKPTFVAPPITAAPRQVMKTVLSANFRPLGSLADIKVIDDLKRLTAENLRQGSLIAQINKIKNEISHLAAVNNLPPYYAVTAFEASPLFRSYLNHGSARIEGNGSASELQQAEFEAITDLRKEIERL